MSFKLLEEGFISSVISVILLFRVTHSGHHGRALDIWDNFSSLSQMWQVPELYTPLHKGDRFHKANKGSFAKDLYVGPNHKTLSNVENRIEKGAIAAVTATMEILPPKPREKNRPVSPSRAKSNMIVFEPKTINSFTQGFETHVSSSSTKKGKAPLKLLRKSASDGGLRALVKTPTSRIKPSLDTVLSPGKVFDSTVKKPLTPITDLVTELNDLLDGPNTIETAEGSNTAEKAKGDVVTKTEIQSEVAAAPSDEAPAASEATDTPVGGEIPQLSPSAKEPAATNTLSAPSPAPVVVVPVQGLETPSVALAPMSGLGVKLIGDQNAPVSVSGDSAVGDTLELAELEKSFVDAVAIPLVDVDLRSSANHPRKHSSAGAALGTGRAVRQAESTLEIEPTETSFLIHTQMGGWNINSLGRHNDHNMQRISRAVKSVNEVNVRKSSTKIVQHDTNMRELIMTSPCTSPAASLVLSAGEDDTFGVVTGDGSDAAVTNASSGHISLNLSPGGDISVGANSRDKVIDNQDGDDGILGLDLGGVESGDGNVSTISSQQAQSPTGGNTYQRSANLSVASTDADALDGEFIESLDYVNVVPGSIDHDGTGSSVASESSFSNTMTNQKVFGGGFVNQPYQVHNRIMGWKLTSLPKRNKIVKMLDRISEISTNEMVDLSYSRVVFPTDPATISKKLSMTDRSDTGLSDTDPNRTITFGQEYAVPDSNDPDQRLMMNALQSRTLNKVWTADPKNLNPVSFTGSSTSTGYGHLSEREIFAIEKDVSRRLNAFASTPLGKADKIKRIIKEARQESDDVQADRTLLNLDKANLSLNEKTKQSELLQRYLAKEREKAELASKKPKSMLQRDLLRQRDRSEILFAAKQITNEMVRKHNHDLIHQLDDSLHPRPAVPEPVEIDPLAGLTLGVSGGVETPQETDWTTVATSSSGNTTPNQLNISRSALWQSVARPPPVAKQAPMPSATFKNIEAMGAAMQYGETIPTRPVLSALHPVHVPTPKADNEAQAAIAHGFTPSGSRQIDRNIQSDSDLHAGKDSAYMKGIQSEPYLQHISQPGTPKLLSRPTSPKA